VNSSDSKNYAVECLGESDKKNFPLLLFFGREYNYTESPVVIELGTYNFRDSPRSAFWNRAYGLVERICKLNYFKRTCIELNASPILFSNLSPIPILNKISDSEKDKRRKEIKDDVIRDYIEGIFNMPIIKRVRLVVISAGKEKIVFERFTRPVKRECERQDITVLETLGYIARLPMSTDEIDGQLSESERNMIRSVIEEFYKETGTEKTGVSWAQDNGLR
jgi:hypothetical protein